MLRVLCALLALGGAAAHAAELTDVNIAVSSVSFVLGGERIAEQAKLYEKNGLRPHVIVMDSGNAAMTALIGGSVQFTVAGPSEVLAARAHHQDIAIAVNLYRGLASAVVLHKDVAARTGVDPSGPLAARLKALDELTIAVPSATSALLGPVRNAAEAAGAHIHWVYMSQPAMVAALESRAVQGIDASFPFAGTPILKGYGVIYVNGPSGELGDVSPSSSSCIATTTSYATAHPAIIAALRKTSQDLAEFIRDHPDDAKAALAKGYPQLTAPEIDLAFSQQWKNWTQPVFTVADMKHEAGLLVASTNMPGVSELDPASALLK